MEEDMNQKLLREVDAAGEISVVDQVPLKDKVWSEMKKMWVVAVPAIFTRASTFGINVITQAFVGHIGSTELAAYSFIYTVFLSFAIGILLGMATALQTLCGQAYGARKYHMLGVYLQRSWIVMFLASIILLPIFIFATQILEALGQFQRNKSAVSTSIATVANTESVQPMAPVSAQSQSFGSTFSISKDDLVNIIANVIRMIGVAIGAGLQSIVAYVNLTAYYLVGIPVGAVLGFVFDMEVKGVWIGMLFGTFVQTVVLIIMTYKTNWDEQVIIARNRVNRWTVKDGNEPDHTT
nr:protein DETOXIFICATION 22-like [Quercus suber]